MLNMNEKDDYDMTKICACDMFDMNGKKKEHTYDMIELDGVTWLKSTGSLTDGYFTRSYTNR